jgi:aspartyl-tRNA(Asn)/glutamyl-tRNA(Gln) amidotransferase subunit B
MIMGEMAKTGQNPVETAQRLNLIQKSDESELETIVEKVIAENPRAAADAAGGGKKTKAATGFLLGQVMQKTAGRANPKIVSQILAKKLS